MVVSCCLLELGYTEIQSTDRFYMILLHGGHIEFMIPYRHKRYAHHFPKQSYISVLCFIATPCNPRIRYNPTSRPARHGLRKYERPMCKQAGRMSKAWPISNLRTPFQCSKMSQDIRHGPAWQNGGIGNAKTTKFSNYKIAFECGR